MIEIFQFPFMQRAFIAGIVIAAVLAFLGVFVILRRMAFFGDGIAHASLAGIAIGLLAAVNPILTAIVFSVVFALLIYFFEKKTKLSSDVVIGILFTASMALGVILINLKQGYQPELISFLFGNILAIKTVELILMVVLAVFIFTFLIVFHKKITLLTLHKESAYLIGIKVTVLEIVFYIILAISVVLGVKLLGIILVSALLVLPASIAKLVSKSFKELNILNIVFAEIIVMSGLILSYFLNWPSGATIIVFGTGIFILVVFGQILFKKTS